MDIQSSQASRICPHRAGQAHAPAPADADARRVLPALRRISEIEKSSGRAGDCANDSAAESDSALRCVATWVREFLARPHAELGRKGSVCPFVPLSLVMDTIWLVAITHLGAGAGAGFDSIAALVGAYRDLFLETEPTRGPDALQKSFLIVFPTLLGAGPGGAALVDRVQCALKQCFVDMGLMLGEFHATNDCPGLRNGDFRPLRSPVPLLAIRHMVESDLPFLTRECYPARQRSLFLRSYLTSVGSQLKPAKFNHVLDRLVAAEIEQWVAARQPQERAGLAP